MPYLLRCEYAENPLGIDVVKPRLSWAMRSERRGALQKAYQVLVASTAEALAKDKGDLWDSGRVESRACGQIAYGGKTLQSGQRAFWKVCCWDEAGRSEWSEVAWFEMALLDPADWKGAWITGGGLLRKEWDAAKPIKSARLYVSAVGYFEAHVNGYRVGDFELEPGQTTYSKRALYTTHDVTPLLRKGPNAMGIMLGRGWLEKKLHRDGVKAGYGEDPLARVQLNITFEDGSHAQISSDNSWQAMSGPLVENSLKVGEVYDARLERPGWNKPGYKANDMAPARVQAAHAPVMTAQLCDHDRVIERITPVSHKEPAPGVHIYDLGQNIAGWARIRVRGAAGTKVQLRFAELLNAEGRLDGYTNYHQQDVYILKGEGLEEWRPRFTWHGFRYIEVTASPELPEIEAVTGEVVHTAAPTAGTFTCSNDLLNRVQTISRWSLRTNMHGGVPSDCPHRERLGYGGDAVATAEAAIYNFDLSRFFTKWVRDMADAQGEDGWVPNTIPWLGGGGGPMWGAAYILVPWHVYCYYGDTRLLKDHYEGMQRYLAFLTAHSEGHIMTPYGNEWSFLGEWCAPGRAQDSGKAIDRERDRLFNTFAYFHVADMLSRIANVLGKKEDAAKHGELAKAIAKAFHATYFDAAQGWYGDGFESDNFGILYAGMAPEAHAEKLREKMLEDIQVTRKGHLDTGFYGTKYLFNVLTRSGHVDVAYGVATQTTQPSWGHWLAQGATTLWEQWNGMYSHNHPAFCSISEWYFKGLAGLQADPGAPGFAHVNIYPAIPKGLDHAKGILDTFRGTFSSEWRRAEKAFTLDVTIPANSTASVRLPAFGWANPVVTEGGKKIWADGKFAGARPGMLKGTKEKEGALVFEIGSGTYSFRIAGE